MRRIALITVAVAMAAFPSVASARAAGGGAAAQRAATIKTEWTAEYNFSAGYGGVKCVGKTVTNKKYPESADIEKCESTEGGFKHMKAGKEQHAFELEGGGAYNEWESDSGSGKRTTNYKYSVNTKLTKFKIVAIY